MAFYDDLRLGQSLSSILGFIPAAHDPLSFQLEMSNVHFLHELYALTKHEHFFLIWLAILTILRQQSLLAITRLN